MKAYRTRSFQREAKNDGVSDEDCAEALRRAERGLIDADLGGCLIKQRIPRGNRGAAKGSSAIIFYKREEIAVYLHIFPKSGKANLTRSELEAYRAFAQELEKLTAEKFEELVAKKGWRELQI
ncbi:protein of unknown function DUF1044 [Methylocella silvestris BL2]|uniref:Addiction module toxin RelE n=2 Tax=Methylocella silvestris TaxID=199596 RepID=B8EM80_METSB|nr:protein of unknown function DUF1044 [Methylocella silvestris BL2]